MHKLIRNPKAVEINRGRGESVKGRKIERQTKHHKNPNPKIKAKPVFEEAKGEDSSIT